MAGAGRARGGAGARAGAGGGSARPPVAILPGLGNCAGDYAGLEGVLRGAHGFSCVETASVARTDWLRNAAGLLDPSYWQGTLKPRPTVDWYLSRVDEAVDRAATAAAAEGGGGGGVVLLGHSAGGWLARVWMKAAINHSLVQALVTLGTPNLPIPEGTGFDQTRGILRHLEAEMPGAFHAGEGVRYVTIASKYLEGLELRDGLSRLGEEGALARLAGGFGYQQVCGDATAWGDGITPVPSAHLPGAEQVTLEGVYHSPLGQEQANAPWYGDPEVVEQWVQHLIA